jgi:hypothetical protein
MENTFQKVVKEYRHGQGLSVGGFAEKITEQLVNATLSGQAISKWEKDLNRALGLYLFLNCATTYTDWQIRFAVDSLKASCLMYLIAA